MQQLTFHPATPLLHCVPALQAQSIATATEEATSVARAAAATTDSNTAIALSQAVATSTTEPQAPTGGAATVATVSSALNPQTLLADLCCRCSKAASTAQAVSQAISSTGCNGAVGQALAGETAEKTKVTAPCQWHLPECGVCEALSCTMSGTMLLC